MTCKMRVEEGCGVPCYTNSYGFLYKMNLPLNII